MSVNFNKPGFLRTFDNTLLKIGIENIRKNCENVETQGL